MRVHSSSSNQLPKTDVLSSLYFAINLANISIDAVTRGLMKVVILSQTFHWQCRHIEHKNNSCTNTIMIDTARLYFWLTCLIPTRMHMFFNAVRLASWREALDFEFRREIRRSRKHTKSFLTFSWHHDVAFTAKKIVGGFPSIFIQRRRKTWSPHIISTISTATDNNSNHFPPYQLLYFQTTMNLPLIKTIALAFLVATVSAYAIEEVPSSNLRPASDRVSISTSHQIILQRHQMV
jgi:hypothetical protein